MSASKRALTLLIILMALLFAGYWVHILFNVEIIYLAAILIGVALIATIKALPS